MVPQDRLPCLSALGNALPRDRREPVREEVKARQFLRAALKMVPNVTWSCRFDPNFCHFHFNSTPTSRDRATHLSGSPSASSSTGLNLSRASVTSR